MDKIIIELLNIFSSIIALSINVVAQIINFRIFTKLGLLKSIFIGFIVGLLSLLLIEYYLSIFYKVASFVFLFASVANLLAYTALGYCYFHFINLGETARRIRILSELYESKNGLTLNEILSKYNAEEIVKKRAVRLLHNNQIVFHEGRFLINKSILLIIAKTIVFLKIFILGKSQVDN